MKRHRERISRIHWPAAMALLAGVLLMPTVMASGPSQAPEAAPTYTVLHSLAGSPTDGANPRAGLILDSSGNLYGTTFGGGAFPTRCNSHGYGCGTAFKLDATGIETVLHSFAGSGANPAAGLIRDAVGNLYGTTFAGGGSSYN